MVERNLDGGRIQLAVETKDGLAYLVSRSWGEQPIVLTADGKPTELSLRLGGVFQADIYSQNEVERIADEATSQLELIDNFEAQNLAELDREIAHLTAELGTNASQIVPLETQMTALGEELGLLTSVEERLKAFTRTKARMPPRSMRPMPKNPSAIGSSGRSPRQTSCWKPPEKMWPAWRAA